MNQILQEIWKRLLLILALCLVAWAALYVLLVRPLLGQTATTITYSSVLNGVTTTVPGKLKCTSIRQVTSLYTYCTRLSDGKYLGSTTTYEPMLVEWGDNLPAPTPETTIEIEWRPDNSWKVRAGYLKSLTFPAPVSQEGKFK